ncbi:MAG: hypothetical protein Q8Q16_04750, partial [Betaproteobacteria bacterium]|nr:hypothetical protein [Betaproteobacteria bacterium]
MGLHLICIKRADSGFITLAASASRLGNGFDQFVKTYYIGNDVRFRRMRYLTIFLAAMFFANNVVAAVRACVADGKTQEHVAISAPVAAGGEPLCPPSDDAGPCLTHYVQSYQNDEQKFWADFPPVVIEPVLGVLQIAYQARPKLLVIASA